MFLLKFLVVAGAAFLAFRRSGLWGHPLVRALLRPGIAPTKPPEPRASRFGDRVFLVLLVMAATAVAAVIVTRMLILAPASGAR